jgi:hypothetical protein
MNVYHRCQQHWQLILGRVARQKISAPEFSISVQSKKFLPGETEGTGHTNWKAKDVDNKGFYAVVCQHSLILTQFYTRVLDIVVLHVMVPQQYTSFPLAF